MTADPATPQPPISTRADRFLRACRREPVDATPVWFMRQAGRSLPAYRAIRKHASLLEITADAALCAQVTLQPVERLGVDAAILFADITSPLPGMGVPLEIREGVGPVIDPPVDTLAATRALRPFEPEQAVAPLLEAIRLIRRDSPVPLIGFAGAPFTLASYMVTGRSSRDAEGIKTLMRAEPATFDALLSRLVDTTIAYVSAQVGAGVQAIQLFDSWVGTLSPFDYERSVLPHMRRLFDGIRPLGVPLIHFGTGSAALLALQAEAGGDVIGLDWRIGLDDGWSRVPDRAVQGNLDPTALLGPWSGVQEQARWVLAQAGSRPGHIFNLGHGVLPPTDPEDLRRLVDLVHEETAR
ncbi:MAG: uroporphyrinogen decarboxylase [Chloroflexota bacterium]|nr:uroporphyrinogen decarboxylase [Chloroflexota bacterium]